MNTTVTIHCIGKSKGGWAVDRVVGTAQLYKEDVALKDHLTQALTPRKYNWLILAIITVSARQSFLVH